MDGLRSLETLLVDELLLQQRAGAQNQVRGMMQDTSGSIAEQNEQQLAAGAQQMVRPKLEARMMKERQDQARQRQALAGIAGQSAPNMARMADGGIVGYSTGGMPEVGAKSKGPIPSMTPEQLEYVRKMSEFRKSINNPANTPEQKQRALQELQNYQRDVPVVIQEAVESMMRGPAKMPSMQAGGAVKKYAGPDGSDVVLEEEYNLTPEGIERLLDLDELTEEAQEVETEAPRERPMTPEERMATIDPERFDARMGRNIEEFAESAVDFVRENPLLAASMVVPGGLAARGLGSLGLAGLRRFGPGMLESAKRVAALGVSKPRMSGYGSAVRNPRTGRMMSAKDAQAAGVRLNRQASPMRMATTASGIGLLTEAAGRMAGGDGEVAAEGVAAAPGPREPTAQEKLGSAGEPAQGRGRDIDIDRLISFLQGGADQQNIAGALAGGSRADIAYQQGERKRQDEVEALDEMRKLEREKIDAQLEAAGVRATATQRAAMQKLIGEYLNSPSGFRVDLANFVGKDISELTPEDEATYGDRVIQNYISRVSGQTSQAMAQLPEGVTVTRKDS